MKFRKALVTGGAGFIGSHIVESLLSRGMKVVVLDDFSMGKRENIPSDAVVVEGDVLDVNKVNLALDGVDIVFHQAAKVSIRSSVAEFYKDAQTNIMGTINIWQAMKDHKVRKFIYASSMAVYGNSKYLPLDEEHPKEPISPYGISKLAGEKYCLNLGGQMGIDTVVLRYFNTYGPRQTLTPYVGVITIFINRLLENKPPIIFGDGTQVRDFISVKDVAEANMKAMDADCNGEVCNVGTGIGTNVNKIADILIQKIGNGLLKEHTAPVVGEPGNSIASISKAEKVLGFKAKHGLDDDMENVIEWIKSKRNKIL
jgi:UDP-glucose 4-epimerase